jgi:hypothetical protein
VLSLQHSNGVRLPYAVGRIPKTLLLVFSLDLRSTVTRRERRQDVSGRVGSIPYTKPCIAPRRQRVVSSLLPESDRGRCDQPVASLLLERGLVLAKSPAQLRAVVPDILENAEADLRPQMRNLLLNFCRMMSICSRRRRPSTTTRTITASRTPAVTPN